MHSLRAGGAGLENLPVFLLWSAGVAAWTWLAYSLHRWVKFRQGERMHATEHGWMLRHRKALAVGTLVALLASLLPFWMALEVGVWKWLWWGGMAAVLSLTYAGWPGWSGSPIREVPGAKIWVIAGAWTFSTAAMPMAFLGVSASDPALWSAVLARFLVICALTLPFDIRDLELDDLRMCTLPQIIGPRKSIVLALGLRVADGLLNHSMLKWSWVAYGFMGLLIATGRYGANGHPHRPYCWLDGSIILLGLIAWLPL